jgi:predicted ATPase/DNA-binding CsgD family transcriptional regulator
VSGVQSPTCQMCGVRIVWDSTAVPSARRSRYCSNACRQRAYRRRARATVSPSSLPEPVDRFVGRTSELAAVGGLLRRQRLVTVVGPAGVGKTRLVLEVASRVQRSFRAGIHVVELASVADPANLADTVAAVTGIPRAGGASLAERLTERLANVFADRKALLILDNCEHMVDACGVFAGVLLSRCPRLVVLATSREALQTADETVYRLDGLAAPATGGDVSMAACVASDAVRLFVDRARAAGGDFELSEDVAAAVATVCAQVDGLPLAIELAARMVRLLPVGEIAARLNDEMFALTARARTADHRHRNLRAAIEWSYGLMTRDEQAAFRRLSVFVGGFGLDGAAAVCAADDLPAATVPEIVARLVEKSMVGRSGVGRFRMLEAIRRYGRERLRSAGEETRTYDRLVDWLSRGTEPLVERVEMAEAPRRLRDEHDNVVHVLERLGGGDDERQLLLAGALVYVSEVASSRTALARALESTSSASRFRTYALASAAWGANGAGDLATVATLTWEGLELEQRWNRPAMLARLNRIAAWVCFRRGDLDSGIAHMVECARQARSVQGDNLVAVAFGEAAWFLLLVGDLDRAATFVDRALPIAYAAPDQIFTPAVLHTAGALALERAELADARRYFADSLRQQSALPRHRAEGVEGLAIVAGLAGRPERCLCLVRAAREMRHLAQVDGDTGTWWQDRVDAARAAARDVLPAERAATAVTAGSHLDPSATVDYALGDEASLPTGLSLRSAVPLDQRQWEVARLVSDGLTNSEIAGRLRLSVRTVEQQVRTIRVALNLRSRAQVGAWAARHTAESGLQR